MIPVRKFNFDLSPNERLNLIKRQIQYADDDRTNSLKFEKLLYSFDLNHLYENKNIYSKSIKEIFDEFYEKFMSTIFKKLETRKSNLFYETGAFFLSNTNIINRALTTELGNVWEQIACLSEMVLSPEETFGKYKVKGVDLIIKRDGELYFSQIKTKQDTLTGSQLKRSRDELSVFKKSMFIAAHSLGDWTFSSHPKINRISGTDFWDLINLDYSEIMVHTTKTVKSIEFEMLKYFNKSK